MTAKKETYNGVDRVKFSINKAVLNIDYAQESAMLAKQIELLKGSFWPNKYKTFLFSLMKFIEQIYR